MSGTRAITLTLDVRGAEQVQQALQRIGPVGEEALRRLSTAGEQNIDTNARLISSFADVSTALRGIGFEAAAGVAEGFSATLSRFAGVGGPLALVAAGAAAAYGAYQNWREITDTLARGMDYLAGRTRLSVTAFRDLRTALDALDDMEADPADLALRRQAESRIRAVDAVDRSLDPLRREVRELQAERNTLQGQDLGRLLDRAGTTPAEDRDQIVALRAQRNAARIAEIEQRIAEREVRIRDVEGRLERRDAGQPVGTLPPTVVTGGGGGAAPIDEDLLRAARAASDFAKAQDEIAKAAERAMNAIDPGRAALSKYQEQVDAMAAAQSAGVITGEQYYRGLADAAKTYTGEAAKLGQQTQVTDQIFGRLSSSFEQALTSGKRFGEVVRGITDDLAKLLIRISITEPAAQALKSAFNAGGGFSGLFGDIFSGGYTTGDIPTAGTMTSLSQQAATFASSGFAFADGGIMTSRGPVQLRRYAGGGIANSPQLAMFGEGSTPEAYVPVPSGRIPVEMRGGQGGLAVVLNIDARGAGPREIDILRAQIPQIAAAAVQEAALRGGTFARAVRGR